VSIELRCGATFQQLHTFATWDADFDPAGQNQHSAKQRGGGAMFKLKDDKSLDQSCENGELVHLFRHY